ncbi:MAG: AI-2E family transporter [Acidimicrobiales bacterium]
MSDIGATDPTPTRWRIPAWYRRVGLVSWFFLGIVAAIALFAALIAATSEITAPLILGAFLAVVFSPAVDWLEHRGLSRGPAAMGVLIGLVIVIGAVGWVTGVALVDQADELSSNLDKAMSDIRGWLVDTPVNEDLVDQVRSTTAGLGPELSGGLTGRVVSIVDSAFGFLTGAILGTVVLYYLLKDGSKLVKRGFEQEADADRRAMLERIGERTIFNVRNYFKGRTAMAVVNGAAIAIAAALLGVPAAGTIGVVNFFGAYVPYLGAFIGGAFAVLMALGEGGITLALIVLGITLAVNLLLENLLEPALIGDSLDIHPLLILLATALGGLIAGMIGLVLAAPALAVALDIETELRSSGFFDEDD